MTARIPGTLLMLIATPSPAPQISNARSARPCVNSRAAAAATDLYVVEVVGTDAEVDDLRNPGVGLHVCLESILVSQACVIAADDDPPSLTHALEHARLQYLAPR